jgi:peroxiredoxin
MLSPTLQATNAEAAWTELTSGSRPPPSPPEWRTTPPTTEEQQKFYMPFVRALTGRAMDFYTKFPKSEHAAKAKMMEFRFLSMTVAWGDTSQKARLEALEKSLPLDPSITGDDHFAVLMTVAQASQPEQARPMLQEIADSATAPAKIKTAATEMLQKMKALGKPVDLQFTAVDGRSVDLAALKGKVVLIDFWATWCGPCVGEVPNVKKTYDQFHARGFEIVGISLDKDKDSLTNFVAEHKMAWPQFFDGQYWQNKYAKQFGIESIPTMWLIDKKGDLRDINARENLSGGVQKLLAE